MHKLDYAPSYCTMMHSSDWYLLTVEFTENYLDTPKGTVLVCYHPTDGGLYKDCPSMCVWLAVPMER